MLKTLKKNAMALVALAIAASSFTIMSFGAKTNVDELVWFEVESGTIQTDQQAPSGPGGDCNTSPNATICLAAFLESQLVNGEAPSSNPNDAEDLAYRPNP